MKNFENAVCCQNYWICFIYQIWANVKFTGANVQKLRIYMDADGVVVGEFGV